MNSIDYERLIIILAGIVIVSGATLLVSDFLRGGSQAQTYIVSYSDGNSTAVGVATKLPDGTYRLDSGKLLSASANNISVIKAVACANASVASCQKCETCPETVDTCANTTNANQTQETPSCFSNNERCSYSKECCSGYCNTSAGRCGVMPSCYGVGEMCTASATAGNALSCCSGLSCNPNTGACEEQCKAIGIACDKDTACCSGYCNDATKKCDNKNVSYQCTSQYCASGTLYTSCHWDSDISRCACNQAACDSQQCTSDGTGCVENTACTENRKDCQSSSDCCSKYCNTTAGTCAAYPKCDASYCENGVFYTNCAFNFMYNGCSCSGESICSTGRCTESGTACDKQACPESYCKNGVLFYECATNANGGCSCKQSACPSQQCNVDGWTCAE